MNTRTAILLLFLGDIAALLLAFITTAELTPMAASMLWGNDAYAHLTFPAYLQKLRFSFFITIVALFMFYNRGHYTQRVPWWGQVQYVLQECGVALLLSGFVYYAVGDDHALVMVAFYWLALFAFILLLRRVVQGICRRIGRWTIAAVIIGDRQNTLETLFTLSEETSAGYDVKSILLRDRQHVVIAPEDLPPGYRHLPIHVGINGQVERFIRENPHVFYIIALDTFRGEERDKTVALLKELSIPFVIVLPIKRVSLYGMEPHFFFGHDTMFLRLRSSIESPLGKLTKRLFDILVSAVAIALLLPFLLVVALLIRRDGGKVFFGHTRVGQHGRAFQCWKFRTMVTNAGEVLKTLLETSPEAKAEWEKDFKLRNDPRVTKVGQFLRKTSLDEMPQLWNVLKGEMSLVGPRPIVDGEKHYYGESLQYYLAVKPGITGLWQVSGRNDTSYDQRVLFDGWYVRNWSLWNDIVILIKTVQALVFRRGAY